MTRPADDLAEAEEEARRLAVELESVRTVGTAVGIVVERLRIGVDEAYEVLAALAEKTGCEVYDLAAQLTHDGRLSG